MRKDLYLVVNHCKKLCLHELIFNINKTSLKLKNNPFVQTPCVPIVPFKGSYNNKRYNLNILPVPLNGKSGPPEEFHSGRNHSLFPFLFSSQA